jgi:hypothetical protein
MCHQQYTFELQVDKKDNRTNLVATTINQKFGLPTVIHGHIQIILMSLRYFITGQHVKAKSSVLLKKVYAVEIFGITWQLPGT